MHLSPKAFELLVCLARCRPEALSKQDLLERVWPGTFVTDASLARTVHEIRAALGEGIVRTVHGFGYACPDAAPDGEPVTTRRGAAWAWLLRGTEAIPLRGPSVTLGRDPQSDVPIASTLASWHHARIDTSGATAVVHDLGSKNGTTVRGIRIRGEAALADGDELGIAGLVFVLRFGAKVQPTATAHD
ncbi:MAG: winged helix-turn-helix domain-containing protein [Vicinamibacterales bacterium]